MYLKKFKLNKNDMRLLKFLAKYKIINSRDVFTFYNSSYYQKRLQELKNCNYIRRYCRTYIKLTSAGIRYLNSLGIECATPCRNKSYIERLYFISKLGLFFEKYNINYKLSWEMKKNNYTEWSRRFIGEITLRNEKYLLYYAKSDNKYIRQLQFDINKDLNYQNVLVLTDTLNIIDTKNNFIFPCKTVCLIVSKDNLKFLKEFDKQNIKNDIERILNSKITEGDFSLSDYKLNDVNIIYMPFLDTHKIQAINSFYNLEFTDSNINIITFSDNIDKIKKMLMDKARKKCFFTEILQGDDRNE